MSLHLKKMRKFLIPVIAALLALSLILIYTRPEPYRPLHPVDPAKAPIFSDDFNLESLIHVTRTQIKYLEKQDLNTTLYFAGKAYLLNWLLFSAREFLAILETQPTGQELDSFIRENYDIYQAGGRKASGKRGMLVTGYYEPVFQGSLERVKPYLTPIYRRPPALVSTRDADGKERTGRLDHDNTFKDFWSRAEIEDNNHLKGYELAYLKDPFDAFLLHVQGSGKLLLPDNSTLAVRFAGSNGLEYRSIGKLLVDEKKIPIKEVSIPVIRDYLRRHPEDARRILHANPRFIFFAQGDDLGPRGSTGEILTPARSIAIDWKALPGYALAYLVTRRPKINENGEVVGWLPVRRFVFAQDSGSAIEGTGRVDLFWGNGLYAETAANHMKEEGSLFFLVKKLPGTE